MLKKLLASTAIVALMAGGAVAQSDNTQTQAQGEAQVQQNQNATGAGSDAAQQQTARDMLEENEYLASELIGMGVYTSTGEDAEEIASVQDIILDETFAPVGVVLNTGGFFGLGGNDYAVSLERIQVTRTAEGEIWLTSDLQPEDLEARAPFVAERPSEQQSGQGSGTNMSATGEAGGQTGAEVNEQAMQGEAGQGATGEGAGGDMQTSAETSGQASGQTTAQGMDSDGTTGSTTGAIDAQIEDPGSYDQPADLATLTADDLTGTYVLGANDETVGYIDDVIVTQDGEIEAVVIDVGGFLGIGAKPVAVAYDRLEVRQNADAELVVVTGFTQEQLEGAPEYSEEAYGQDPQSVLVEPTM